MFTKQELLIIWTKAQTRRGWLYAMENPQNPGVIKVGLTRKDPFKRSKSATTAGILGKYHVLLAFMYVDCYQAEVLAHNLLEPYHVEKELFLTDLNTVKNILLSVQVKDILDFNKLDTSFLLYDLTSDRWLAQADY